jgi:hypothetical protein
MARRKFASRAEELRHHRKCFELALELGCTPAEADSMMARVEARERHRALCRRQGHQNPLPPLKLPTTRDEFERWEAAWMMRD